MARRRDSEAYSSCGSSSLTDYDCAEDDWEAGGDEDEEEEPGTAIPPELVRGRRVGGGSCKRRALRPLNRETETYVWSVERAQLSRVLPGEEAVDGEVIVFPAGSCEFRDPLPRPRDELS